jgi:hypothetical protein
VLGIGATAAIFSRLLRQRAQRESLEEAVEIGGSDVRSWLIRSWIIRGFAAVSLRYSHQSAADGERLRDMTIQLLRSYQARMIVDGEFTWAERSADAITFA